MVKMAIKLNKKQIEKVILLKKYLTENHFGITDGAMVVDSEITSLYIISNIWISAAGIKLFGKDCRFKKLIDYIFPEQVCRLVREIKKGDEDFANFIEGKN